MILVDSLSRSYGDFIAVDQVSFEIGKGEIVGLLGHNGAGKTTIMKMLTGYLEPDSGNISIDGHDMHAHAEHAKARIGYLPENLPLYPEMSVAAYLEYAAGLRGLSGTAKWDAVRDAIVKTDLQEKSLQAIATLSRGFRQRVGVAQAILHQPGVLILDEPTNGLDPTQTMHMRKLIHQCAENATVILSTHIMQEVDAICDRVMILRNGKLAVDERLSTLSQGKTLILESDIATSELKKIIDDPSEFINIELQEKHGEMYIHALHLAQHADLKHSAAAAVQMVSDADANLFAIYPYKRDLETLFREVNSGKEYVDVA